jgi:hypothetical protein
MTGQSLTADLPQAPRQGRPLKVGVLVLAICLTAFCLTPGQAGFAQIFSSPPIRNTLPGRASQNARVVAPQGKQFRVAQTQPSLEPLDPLAEEDPLLGDLGRGGPTSRVSQPLRDLTVGIRPSAGTYPGPEEYRNIRLPPNSQPAGERNWSERGYFWEAGAAYHRPLYFEDAAAERHGRTYCLYAQPALSAARFYGQVAALPVCLVTRPPWTCVYTYGYGPPALPGTCVPPGPCGQGSVFLRTIRQDCGPYDLAPNTVVGEVSPTNDASSPNPASADMPAETMPMESSSQVPPSALFEAPRGPLVRAARRP